MRKLMWFSIGFAGSCLLLVSLAGMGPLMIPLFVLAGGMLAAIVLGRKVPMFRILALVLAGAVGSCVWYALYRSVYLEPVSSLDGATRQAVIRTNDYGFETDYGSAVDGMLEWKGRNYPVRAYLDTEESILPGINLEGNFRFRLTTPDGAEGLTSHSGRGILLLAYQQGDLTLSQNQELHFSERTAVFRNRIGGMLQQLLPEGTYPLAKGLLLGDATDLSYGVDTALKVSGIRHVMAVSGLHISILFALITTVAFRNRFLTAALGLPVLFLFAALAGFSPSVNRACIMCALMMAGQLLDREYDPLTALSFSVLVMLLCKPVLVISVSLQLSVASVAGILLLRKPVENAIADLLKWNHGHRKLRSWFLSSVSISLSAMVFTVPLCAWYFGTVSVIGILTNLLTLWIISGIFYGLLLMLLLSAFEIGAATFLGQCVGWMIRFVLVIAQALAAFPAACVYTASVYTVFWLIFGYVLLFFFLFSSKRKPIVFACCLLLSLCVSLLCAYAEPLLHGTVVTVLDVGQGQCILLQSEGRTYLVDCGGDNDKTAADKAAAHLLSRGIRRLDGFILTHGDRDHMGGAENLLTRVASDVLIVPPVTMTQNLPAQTVLAADREIILRWGTSEIRIFGEKAPEIGNENSLCILFDTEKCDILITGDRNREGEMRLLQTAPIPQVDVLIAGHHGSKFATSEELLKTVSPKTVCISVGTDNIYGHPSTETLERLEKFGCKVYRTDIHGNITIRR